uniref:Uncharacterized protein n=1 Tax=Rhizophora mucronata TaxID=61149 RepID=A0A2P2NC55_RHIMU
MVLFTVATVVAKVPHRVSKSLTVNFFLI